MEINQVVNKEYQRVPLSEQRLRKKQIQIYYDLHKIGVYEPIAEDYHKINLNGSYKIN